MLTVLPVVIMLMILCMIVCVVYMASRYRRCPPDRILVIFGSVGNNRSARCIHGGGAFVVPLYQDYSYLSLTPMEKEIDLPCCISSDDGYAVAIKAKATFAIGTEEQLMYNAAERLLNLSVKDIEDLATEIIMGQTRLTIASFPPGSLSKDSIELIEAIKASIDPELNKLGLKILNFYISNMTHCKES